MTEDFLRTYFLRVILLSCLFSDAFSIQVAVGNGATFHVERLPRELQGEVYSLRGYINSVMEVVRSHGVQESSFPTADSIPSPATTKLPISSVVYGSYPSGSTDPTSFAGSFIITIGDVSGGQSGFHEITKGASFRFDPEVVGNQIANWQCYTDIESAENLYPGHIEPKEGSSCPLLNNLGEVFTGCIHISAENEDTPPFAWNDYFQSGDYSIGNGWKTIYPPES